MNKIKDFFKSNRPAITWTICYVFVMWAVLRLMFNFRLFSMTDWTRLAHAELHGFAGLVFGILILAAAPLYVATTAIIVRTKKPLMTIKIPMPKFLKLPAFLDGKKKDDTPTTDAKESTDTAGTAPAANDARTPSRNIPPELRIQFQNARNKIARPQSSALNRADTPISSATPTNNAQPENDNTFPLPEDFDMGGDIGASENAAPTFAPVFSDISFGDDADDEKPSDEPAAPAASVDAPPATGEPAKGTNGTDISKLTDYLKSQSVAYTVADDIVITDKFAIATHSDNDFWIADDETWFATGVARPSPVAVAQKAATERGLRPALFLAATNIMDLDTRRAAWNDAGVLVVTDPSELK